MGISTGPVVWWGWGLWGGGICHSVTEGEWRMGMARGESDVYFGTGGGGGGAWARAT